MPSDNEALLIAVLSQMTVNKINFKVLAQDIGASSGEAARLRWKRYYKKLENNKKNNPRKPVGVTKSTASPTKSFGSSSEDDERGIKEENNEDQLSLPVTPARKLPGRKARVTSFREFADEEEVDGEDQELTGKADEGEFMEITKEREDSWS